MNLGIIRYMLEEGEISKDARVTSNGIITTIAFMLGIVAKENTDNIMTTKLSLLVWWKQNMTEEPKDIKMNIARGDIMESLMEKNT